MLVGTTLKRSLGGRIASVPNAIALARENFCQQRYHDGSSNGRLTPGRPGATFVTADLPYHHVCHQAYSASGRTSPDERVLDLLALADVTPRRLHPDGRFQAQLGWLRQFPGGPEHAFGEGGVGVERFADGAG